jgi:DNA repair protein RecO (recombination protein O)
VRQLRVLHSFSRLGKRLETLSAAQALCDLCLQLTADDPVHGLLSTVLLHLERLEEHADDADLVLAGTVQGSIHLLTLGGYGLPMQSCCLSGAPLDAPLGQWDWRCSLLPEDGFAIDSQPGSAIELNPSELALLQRLVRADLPRRQDGELMGPQRVWLRLLRVVELWVRTHLAHRSRALAMLRETLINPA